jgi:glutathione S-transferase
MAARVLYDLAGADPDRRFSPYCWRAKLALAHKGLSFETIPWRFTEKDVIAMSGQDKVPVLIDGERVVSDSWKIADYLETSYPETPSLFGGPEGRSLARFVSHWTDRAMVMGVVRMVAADVHAHIHEKDRDYFRASREARLGKSLEDVVADREAALPGFRQGLEPLRALLREQPFVGGATPTYADYIPFSLFQWAANVSRFPVLAPDDPLAAWCDRVADLHDGLARKGRLAPAA